MREATLIREEDTNFGTFGRFVCEGSWWFSLELPDRDNRPNLSCIPEGRYEVVRRYSPAFKRETYWLKDVQDRSYILIHSANFAGDIEQGYQTQLNGCIALGLSRGYIINKFGKKQRAILSSKPAIAQLETLLNKEPFILNIKAI